jgi:glc operon protein GlcG
VASVSVATDKARTAALYRRPSKDFEDQASGGRPSALHLAGAVPLQGGLPLIVDGHVVGAVGVSGASSADEDNELAGIGVASFTEGLAQERDIDLVTQGGAERQPAGMAS